MRIKPFVRRENAQREKISFASRYRLPVLHGVAVHLTRGTYRMNEDRTITYATEGFTVQCFTPSGEDVTYNYFPTQQEAEDAMEACALLAKVKFAVDGKAES